MVRPIEQNEFETHFKGLEIRPYLAEQVSAYISSTDFRGYAGTNVDRLEQLSSEVERKRYGRRSKAGPRGDAETLSFDNMHKNWSRKAKNSKDPAPAGSMSFALATLFYFFRDVKNPRYFLAVIERFWEPETYHFQRLYHAKYSDGPTWDGFDEISDRYRVPAPMMKVDFRNLWSGKPLRPVDRVPLGMFDLLLGKDESLNTRQLQNQCAPRLLVDEQPDLFAALNWRAQLSSLRGRERQSEALLNWALDGELCAKLMLVSGPGGVGKSRLAAEILDCLKNVHGWIGGELPRQMRDGDVLEVDGKGVFLIVDYPEENIELVKRLFDSLGNNQATMCPVRIVLLSRENKEAWQNQVAGAVHVTCPPRLPHS